MRAACPVDSVLQAAGDAPVVFGGYEKQRIHCGDRILERTARLRTDGIDVVDVPAKLAARVRMLSTGHGRKNDDADAVSLGIAARSARTLNSAAVEGTVSALRHGGDWNDHDYDAAVPLHRPGTVADSVVAHRDRRRRRT